MEELRSIAAKLHSYEPGLYPEDVWDDTLDIRIGRLDMNALQIPDARKPYALAVQAGLYLWNESLDKSHTLSQDIENPAGSLWHGLMHRMEGDYDNARYWLRRAGNLPFYDDLHARVRTHIQTQLAMSPVAHPAMQAKLRAIAEASQWPAELVTDCVQWQVTTLRDERAEAILRGIQKLEFDMLLSYSFDQGFGGAFVDVH